ncbi:MAG: MFS transporter [Clostridia bacterium]|nr:MFS transporter [Clostridia bacterium]
MRKLRSKRQIVLYAASGLGINLLNTVMASYLCSALLVGGFKGDAINYQTFAQKDLVVAALWAAFAFIAKVIDGVIDVPMAAVTDGLRSKWGRRRPSLIIGLVPLLISYVLFLLVPDPSGASVLNTVYYGVILCIFYTFYTLTMVTYYATYTEILENEQQRSLMSNVKSVCDIVYFILGYVAVRALLNGLNIRIVALLVLPLSATMLIPLFMIKEPSNKDQPAEKSKRLRLIPSLTYTFKNSAFIKWMTVYSFMTFGVQLFLSGINEYFSFVGMNMIFVMMSAFAPVPFTLILYNKIQKKYGFGAAFRYVLLTFVVGMLAMFGVGFVGAGTAKLVLSIITGLISSFAIGAMFAVAYSIPSQLAAEEEQKNGVSNSAMYFAVQGLFAGVASGIGSGIVLTALKKGSEKGGSAMIFLTVISAAGALVSFALTFILPKTMIYLGKVEKKDKK